MVFVAIHVMLHDCVVYYNNAKGFIILNRYFVFQQLKRVSIRKKVLFTFQYRIVKKCATVSYHYVGSYSTCFVCHQSCDLSVMLLSRNQHVKGE